MADEAPTSKACTKCGVVKPLGEFYKQKAGRCGVASACKKCQRDAINPEKLRLYGSTYRAKNPDKCRAKTANWEDRNRKMLRDKYVRLTADLGDRYVAKRLGISLSEAPTEIIKLKREQLTVSRLTNQLKKEMKNVE